MLNKMRVSLLSPGFSFWISPIDCKKQSWTMMHHQLIWGETLDPVREGAELLSHLVFPFPSFPLSGSYSDKLWLNCLGRWGSDKLLYPTMGKTFYILREEKYSKTCDLEYTKSYCVTLMYSWNLQLKSCRWYLVISALCF